MARERGQIVNYKIGFRVSVAVWVVLVILVLMFAEWKEPPVVVQEVTEVTELTAVYEPWEVDREDAKMLARLTWCEARGCSVTEQAAVMWCVLNRVDDPRFPDSIHDVILQVNQFYYISGAPVTEELLSLALDVLARWRMEDLLVDSGRVLPEGYCWFRGDGQHNYFRDAYIGGNTWDWSLPSPYEEEAT